MALAQRLNELDLANSQGLLSDDEYRLLRQNVFEQYKHRIDLPVEHPLVPIANPRTPTNPRHFGGRKADCNPHIEPQHPPLPTRTKNSISSGVANLLKRARGRTSSAGPQESRRADDPGRTLSRSPLPVANSTMKRGVIPRILSRKNASDLIPLRTEAYRTVNDTPLLSPRIQDIRSSSSEPRRSSSTATHSQSSTSAHTSLSSNLVPRPSISDASSLSDDIHLTSKDLHAAIAKTEAELYHLVYAFTDLERATLRRIQRQNARRLPSSTPASVDVLIEGREWREHRAASDIPTDNRLVNKPRLHRRIPAPIEIGNDGLSTHSGSSATTSLSLSKSLSSLLKHPLGSPLSPHFRTSSNSLKRKNSLSSISSQGTSRTSGGRLGVNTGLSVSRSMGNLPLTILDETERESSTYTVLADSDFNVDHDPEIVNVRMRKEEMMARYSAHIEYLRAKLRGAELHEKLLRR